MTKQVITEAPDIPGRLRKHTDNSIVVSFAINVFFLDKAKVLHNWIYMLKHMY